MGDKSNLRIAMEHLPEFDGTNLGREAPPLTHGVPMDPLFFEMQWDFGRHSKGISTYLLTPARDDSLQGVLVFLLCRFLLRF